MGRLFLLVLLLACSAATPAVAQADPCVRYPKGKVPTEHVLPLCVDKPSTDVDPIARVAAIRKTLAIPADWHFLLLNEPEWTRRAGVALRTSTAYSDLDTHITFLREFYVMSAQDEKLRHTIAHEIGHYRCQCQDEATADRIADQLTSDSQ